MTNIYFHPDIDYQGIKDIENNFTSTDKDHLINEASDYICKILKKLTKKSDSILFICGPGHNGLDSLFTAYKLLRMKYNVSIFFTQKNIHLEYVKKYDLNNFIIYTYDVCDSYTYIIDGIFGYGLNRNLDNNSIDLIKSINQSSSKVISLDVPSGLNHATGQSMPVSLRCDLLISLLTMKRGLFTNQGRDSWKEITFCKLINTEITSKNYLVTANKKFGDDSNIKSKDYYHEASHSTHKKSNGVSCIVAGEKPYHGAMILASSAAIQTGSKYLQVYTDSEYANTLPMIMPQIIAKSFSISDFKDSIGTFKQVVIGPGTNDVRAYVEVALENINSLSSLIIDAGALNYIDKNKSYSDKLIITPHPGEAARILNISVSEVQADRYKTARKLYDLFNCLIILKGSGSIIFDGESFYTCMDGNYKMGTAGMGDTLCGILLTETALFQNNLDACIKSVVFHSYASDVLYQESKKKNITPSMLSNKYSELTHGK
jgi:NAD(P)H-hydrate epimerase